MQAADTWLALTPEETLEMALCALHLKIVSVHKIVRTEKQAVTHS